MSAAQPSGAEKRKARSKTQMNLELPLHVRQRIKFEAAVRGLSIPAFIIQCVNQVIGAPEPAAKFAMESRELPVKEPMPLPVRIVPPIGSRIEDVALAAHKVVEVNGFLKKVCMTCYSDFGHPGKKCSTCETLNKR